MSSKVLWHLDAENYQEAQKIFQDIAYRMPQDAIFMSLMTSGSIAPRKLCPEDRLMDWQHQEQGWLFHTQGELKWRRLQGNLFRFVYLGEDSQIPIKAKDASEMLQNLEEKPRQIIADRLRPPILENKNKTMAFQIYEYRNKKTQAREFWRHASIDGANTKERD